MKTGEYVLYCKNAKVYLGKIIRYDRILNKAVIQPLRCDENYVKRSRKVLITFEDFRKKYLKVWRQLNDHDVEKV